MTSLTELARKLYSDTLMTLTGLLEAKGLGVTGQKRRFTRATKPSSGEIPNKNKLSETLARAGGSEYMIPPRETPGQIN